MAPEAEHFCFRNICFVVLLCLASANAACNVCQQNQAACINTTSFYLCFGEGEPNTEALYHCKDGFDCTDFKAICVQSNKARKPSCGDTSQCGLCSAHRNNLFACTSRTTFRMCYGAPHPSSQVGLCPEGSVCDANSDAICVSTAQPHEVTCDSLRHPDTTTSSTTRTELATTAATMASVTPTADATRAPPTRPLTPNEVCATVSQVGLFPTVPSDPRCLRYIYCEFRNGRMRGTENTCPPGTYYSAEREQCTFERPINCV